MASTTNNGLINKLSNHSVEQTVERLKNILQFKGITLFALVDHRRSGKNGNEHVSHQIADFWDFEGGHISYADYSQYCHRPAFEDSYLGR